MSRWLSAPLLCSMLVALTSCLPGIDIPPDDDEGNCADGTCEDRLDIFITRRDGQAFVAGTYTFVFTAPDETRWHFDCSLDESETIICLGQGEIRVALRDKEEFEISMKAAPPLLRVSVSFDDGLLEEQEYSPEYQMVTPNGPDCDPLCFQGAIDLAVSFPEDKSAG